MLESDILGGGGLADMLGGGKFKHLYFKYREKMFVFPINILFMRMT